MAQFYGYSMDGGAVAGGRAVRSWPSVVPQAHYPSTTTPSFNTNIISYGNGIEQRQALDSVRRHVFQLRWGVLKPQYQRHIEDLHNAMRGSFESFYWTHPKTGTIHRVRFAVDGLPFEYFNYELYTIGTQLVEVGA